jgi:hypothetical protein
MAYTQYCAYLIYCQLVYTNTCKLPHTHTNLFTHTHTHLHTHGFTGDSDSSEVTETLLLEAQEQATKNNVPGEDDGDAEEEEVGEGMHLLHHPLCTSGSLMYSSSLNRS